MKSPRRSKKKARSSPSNTRGVAFVTQALRDQITAGAYAPGDRLPTFDQMEGQYGVSRILLRHAVERLKQEGFVSSVWRKGLFVPANPPHLCRYGLVFPVGPKHTAWSKFSDVLEKEACGFSRNVTVYRDVMESEAERARLEADVSERRLGGLLLAPLTYPLADRAPFNRKQVAKSFICAVKGPRRVPTINVDVKGFWEKALNWLKSRERQRVAVLHLDIAANPTRNTVEMITRMATKLGLRIDPDWIEGVKRDSLPSAIEATRRLVERPSGKRPDALVVADDNLTEYACIGLLQAKLEIPRDLSIVSHCNWPWKVPSVLPMRRLGYRAHTFIQLAIQAVENQLHGKPVPDEQRVPALFEQELDTVPQPVAPGTHAVPWDTTDRAKPG